MNGENDETAHAFELNSGTPLKQGSCVSCGSVAAQHQRLFHLVSTQLPQTVVWMQFPLCSYSLKQI